MPSDCQCSTHVETRTVTKVLNSRAAGKKIDRLETEVELLKNEIGVLRKRLRRANVSKGKLIEDLKRHLDNI